MGSLGFEYELQAMRYSSWDWTISKIDYSKKIAIIIIFRLVLLFIQCPRRFIYCSVVNIFPPFWKQVGAFSCATKISSISIFQEWNTSLLFSSAINQLSKSLMFGFMFSTINFTQNKKITYVTYGIPIKIFSSNLTQQSNLFTSNVNSQNPSQTQ